MNPVRIGIPRALLFYRYFSIWDSLFRELGYEVICSPETTAGILREGIRKSTADLCLPVKTFLGHTGAIADTVDLLFIPRYISVEPDAYMCPKILGLPDMVRACYHRIPPVVAPMINVKAHGERTVGEFSRQLARSLAVSPARVEKAVSRLFHPPHHGEAGGKDRRKDFFSGDGVSHAAGASLSAPPGKTRIGIVGRPYLVFDRYAGKNIFGHLSGMDVEPVYLDPSEEEIQEAMAAIPKWVYWSFGKEVVTSAHIFFADDSISGVICVSSAACGPDSFTGDLIRRRLNHRSKPFMSLSIDEHTSDVGILTRLEAFVDMLKKVSV